MSAKVIRFAMLSFLLLETTGCPSQQNACQCDYPSTCDGYVIEADHADPWTSFTVTVYAPYGECLRRVEYTVEGSDGFYEHSSGYPDYAYWREWGYLYCWQCSVGAPYISFEVPGAAEGTVDTVTVETDTGVRLCICNRFERTELKDD